MARGIVLPFTLDPREFRAGLKVITTGLDTLTDDLRDVEKSGDQAFSDLGDTARVEMEKAEDAVRELRTSARDDFRRLERDGQDAFNEVKKEGRQSFSEAFSSFDGSIEGVIEGFQELAAESSGIFKGLGGTVAAFAGAAGIGLILTAYQKWQEAQERINERAREFYDVIREQNNSLDQRTQLMIAQAVISEKSVADQLAFATAAADSGKSVTDYVAALLAGQGTQERMVALKQEQAALDAALVVANQKGTDEQGRTAEQIERQIALNNEKLTSINKSVNATREESAALGKAKQVRDANTKAQLSTLDATTRSSAALGNGATAADGIKNSLNSTRPPDLGGFAADAARARDSLLDAKRYWDSLGPKSVQLTVDYRTRGTPKP